MICRFCGLQLAAIAGGYITLGSRPELRSTDGTRARASECLNGEGGLTLHDPLPEDADATD